MLDTSSFASCWSYVLCCVESFLCLHRHYIRFRSNSSHSYPPLLPTLLLSPSFIFRVPSVYSCSTLPDNTFSLSSFPAFLSPASSSLFSPFPSQFSSSLRNHCRYWSLSMFRACSMMWLCCVSYFIYFNKSLDPTLWEGTASPGGDPAGYPTTGPFPAPLRGLFWSQISGLV